MGRPKRANNEVTEPGKQADEQLAPRRGRSGNIPVKKNTALKDGHGNKTTSKANARGSNVLKNQKNEPKLEETALALKDGTNSKATSKARAKSSKVQKNQKNDEAKLEEQCSEENKGPTNSAAAAEEGDKRQKITKTKRNAVTEEDGEGIEPPNKRVCIPGAVSHSSHRTVAGVVLTVGQGDTGQLGLGPDVQERGKPGLVVVPANAVQVCAGGMHTVCLLLNGEVYTFGCNDEGALGRPTAEDDDCMEPGKVNIPEKIKQVSAGDSHTAALSGSGQVYMWGTFRDANGSIGLLPGRDKIEKPEKILSDVVVSKIVSGCDHLVCLTADGDIYTLGAAEQGQLGRVAESFAVRGGRRGIEYLLIPSLVRCSRRSLKFADVWCGQYVTFAKAKDGGDIYAWGLNNYFQLGIPDMQNKFTPAKLTTFDKVKDWKEISGGQHHTLALDKDGLVYSLGRKDYGRLGLGKENLEEKTEPTLVTSLRDKKCITINCGNTVSFSVDSDGKIYGWGMGCNKQLAQGDDEDDIYEPKLVTGKQLENKKGIMVSAGGQHTVFLAMDDS